MIMYTLHTLHMVDNSVALMHCERLETQPRIQAGPNHCVLRRCTLQS
jgi:hypothetical protein